MLTSKRLIDWLDKHEIPVDEQGKTLESIWAWDISNRKIKKTPKGHDIFAIRSLDLSSKQIKDIPPEIALLKKLEYLSIMDNPVKELPDEFKDLESLEILDVRNTPLAHRHVENLPDTIYGFVCNEESAELIYGDKPEEYFYPVYNYGIIENKFIILRFRDLYDLKQQIMGNKKSVRNNLIFKLMFETLDQKLIEKYAIYLNDKNKEEGIFFKPSDKDEIIKLTLLSSDTLLKVKEDITLIKEIMEL